MKKLLSISLVILMLSLTLVFVVGCPRPPVGTVLTQDSSGNNILAWDKDGDGVADVDAGGETLVVPGSGIYKPAETIDTIAPTVLDTLAAFGIPGAGILVGVAGAWRAHKFGRVFANTVMSVQVARSRLKGANMNEALSVVDDSLGGAQIKETTAMIRDVKEKLGTESVNGKRLL